MRIKKEYIILAVVILSLVLYLVFREQDSTHYRLPEISKIPQSEISKIEIVKPKETIVLSKTDDSWLIGPEGYSANTYNIKSMLEFIEYPVLTAMVSESKNYERYGLGKEKRIIINAYSDSSKRREITLGNSTSGFLQTYILYEKDHRVYHARKNQRILFDKSVDEFRDKKVLTFPKDEINKIHIIKGEKTILLSRKTALSEKDTDQKSDPDSASKEREPVWEKDSGERVDESILNPFLSTLSELQCNNYLYDIKKEDLTDPLFTIKLEGKKEHVLTIFSKRDTKIKSYPSTSSENDYPFMLIEWKAEKIMDTLDEGSKKTE
ncbi:DUF4340 domain-containing protein [Thermodesulfobacteriota bacterium]